MKSELEERQYILNFVIRHYTHCKAQKWAKLLTVPQSTNVVLQKGLFPIIVELFPKDAQSEVMFQQDKTSAHTEQSLPRNS